MGCGDLFHRQPLTGPLGVDYEVSVGVVGRLREHADVTLVLVRHH